MESLTAAPTLVGKRYQLLSLIGKGGMGIVYHAKDRLTGNPVALKQVTAPPEQLTVNAQTTLAGNLSDSEASNANRLALAHEFRTLASLRHPYIISVLDYGFDTIHQPYFTMDLLEDGQTLLVAAQNQPLEVRVRYIMEILQALSYLHRRGILHRDLKPANVMISKGQVKVLDFGLAAAREQGGLMSGTWPYMSPEVFQGGSASESSDLYAVGVMAYEMIAGRHPFRANDFNHLLFDVLNTTPDLDVLAVEEYVRSIIRRLLAKTPEARFASAAEVITEYNLISDKPLSEETATRESFLQAARFVGRAREMQQLDAALAQAVKGQGGAWLLSGESGVGKSRLLDEVRAFALTQGVTVLRGVAVKEGYLPFHIWRDVLRWMALFSNLSDLEAGVLKPLIPDITTLLERPVSDPPQLDAAGTQNRLIMTVEALFQRQRQPLMIVLEDLQWAKNESLALLRRLTRGLKNLPLLIVGTFRSDERVDFIRDLPHTQIMRLERLDSASVEELCVSILGPIGHDPQLVELLQRETEGNVYFLIEVMRDLAKEAGQLDAVGSMTLPQKVFAGGMKLVMKKRLDKIPTHARPLLQVAAIGGRQLDLPALKAAAPETDMLYWLNRGEEASVFEVHEGAWRFTHDKLRETLLSDLTVEQMRGLHQRFAEALETAYPNNSQQAARLTYHFAQAGNPAKEGRYAAVAGMNAVENGAHQEAVQFLTRALAIGVSDPAQRSQVEYNLSEAYYGLGEIEESIHHGENALRVAGYRVPSNRVEQTWLVLEHATRQIAHRLLPGVFVGRHTARRPEREWAASAYQGLARSSYMMNRTIPTLLHSVQAVNLAESVGISPILARTYASIGTMLGVVPLHQQARHYGRMALTTAKAVEGQPGSRAALRWVHAVNGLYQAGASDWANALENLHISMGIAKEMGDWRGFVETAITLGGVLILTDQLQETFTLARDTYEESLLHGDPHARNIMLYLIVASLVRMGRLEETRPYLDMMEQVVRDGSEPGSAVTTSGVLAGALTLLDEHERAQHISDIMLDVLLNSLPVTFVLGVSYAGFATMYAAQWENGHTEAVSTVRRIVRGLKTFAHSFPIGRGEVLRFEGVVQWLDGHHDQALATWRKALDLSDQFITRYDKGVVLYEMARRLPESDPARAKYLSQAQTLFETIGAARMRQIVEALVG